MTGQELVAFGIGVLALAYLLIRYLRRRGAGNCCGEKECPAAAGMVDRINEKLKADS